MKAAPVSAAILGKNLLASGDWPVVAQVQPVGVFTAILCAISAIAVATAREMYQIPTEQLGQPDKRTPVHT